MPTAFRLILFATGAIQDLTTTKENAKIFCLLKFIILITYKDKNNKLLVWAHKQRNSSGGMPARAPE